MESSFDRCPQGPQVKRHGAGRIIPYFLLLIVLNVLLGVFALYMLGFALTYDWAQLQAGSLHAILEAALQLLLLFSPVLLTILVNRLLFRAFHGHGRFPRGLWLAAVFAVLAVQAGTILLVFGYGFTNGVSGLEKLGGLSIETIAAEIGSLGK